jgi:ubiquinone/menaquinone biosynthesis C-methylase UbiE
MDAEEFAKLLMAEERRTRQNPDSIVAQLSILKGNVVADLACGPGYFTIPLSKAVEPSGVVYALDSNQVMIRTLRRNLSAFGHTKNVQIVEADVAKTGLPHAVADVVFFSDVLHDLTDKTAFFAEVKRIAKIGAKFVDIDWHKEDQEIGPPKEKRLSEEESRALIRRNGFSILRAINAGPHHYGFVFERKG